MTVDVPFFLRNFSPLRTIDDGNETKEEKREGKKADLDHETEKHSGVNCKNDKAGNGTDAQAMRVMFHGVRRNASDVEK